MSSKVEELLKLDINEPVFGQTPWVSSLLAVPKENEASALKSDNTRVVIDMHKTSTETFRTRHPIPTKKTLEKFSNCKVFSKTDLQ